MKVRQLLYGAAAALLAFEVVAEGIDGDWMGSTAAMAGLGVVAAFWWRSAKPGRDDVVPE